MDVVDVPFRSVVGLSEVDDGVEVGLSPRSSFEVVVTVIAGAPAKKMVVGEGDVGMRLIEGMGV